MHFINGRQIQIHKKPKDEKMNSKNRPHIQNHVFEIKFKQVCDTISTFLFLKRSKV
jgi:hypothetical protein